MACWQNNGKLDSSIFTIIERTENDDDLEYFSNIKRAWEANLDTKKITKKSNKEYLSKNPESEVGQLIKSLNLTDQQNEIMEKIMDNSLADVFYTILMGLGGNASIGGIQEIYQLKDEKGNQLSGDIEGHAYEYFQENR